MNDLLLDENYDLLIKDGDFVIDDSSQQDIDLIIQSIKTEWKQHPEIGFGISDYLKKTTSDLNRFKRDLKVALETDNIKDAIIKISSDLRELEIEV